MERALEKIRPHTASSLAHQKTPANLLVALESTFREQKTDPSPTAYFAALCTTLDGTLPDQTEVLHAELYLLALVAPFVPTPVIHAHLDTLLSLTAPLFPSLTPHAPALRSQLSLYHTIFQSLDRSHLEAQGIRQTFASVLQLCVDQRPKVRKKAADVVKDVLATPPAPLSRHPYAERVADWVKVALSDASAGPFSASKSNKSTQPIGPDTAIYVTTFLRPVVANLPPASIPAIIQLLLKLPRLGNPYLSQSVYTVLSDLFSLPLEDATYSCDHLTDVLQVVLSSPPSRSDTILSPAWVQVLGNALFAYRGAHHTAYATTLGKVWNTIWAFLDSTDSRTRKAAAESLNNLCRSFTQELISAAVRDSNSRSTLHHIIRQVTKDLDSLAYARAMPEMLSVVASLVTHLQHRLDSTSQPAAELLLLPLTQRVGDLRIQKGFEYKEDADNTLAAAMRVLGPEVLLQILPLNIEPSDRQAGRGPRAYLLPLLPHPHPSPLRHFVTYFVQLSERMYDLQSKAETQGRQAEAKVWSVLVSQVWAGLVGYCWGTRDLTEALTPSFSQLLSQLLYSQPELRPSVLRALKTMVVSNIAIASSETDQNANPSAISKDDASRSLAFLRNQAGNWLAVLFNIFGTVGRDARSMIGDVISIWASIAGEQEVAASYDKVVELFKTNMLNTANTPRQSGPQSDQGSLTAMTQDILLLLLPYLHSPQATSLFQLCMTSEVLGGKDNGVQKRGYKILTKLLESGKVTIDAPSIIQRLDDLSDGLSPAAKKDRFNMLSLLVPSIPPSAMHTIPSLIPEAVLGTKEPSDKARTAAFELILAMAKKMNEGGTVKRHLIHGNDKDGDSETTANVEEFLTMLAGGLAASPHMISASVTAISRVLFEFKDTISHKMHSEIFTTLLVFLSSTNREIVKSILGYVKLSIHTLPTEIITPHLKDLVPALLSWSHDHKNHFKAKVRHIFERMLRRFGWDAVYSAAGEEEAAKVLINIKKRKERSKRKKSSQAQDDADGDVSLPKPATGYAFEDILYGSESEMDDSEDEKHPPTKNNPRKQDVRLRLDDDEPMDLLEGAAARITSIDHRRRKPGQDASRFKTDEDTGKMIIDEDDGPEDEAVSPSAHVAGAAYRENITSADGFTRGPNGKVKFNKDTKKRRREAAASEDVEMADQESTAEAKKPKRRAELKLGHEFKAKKAGGDVKKNGIDPYAYMPLSQAAKKGRGKHTKLGIAGTK